MGNATPPRPVNVVGIRRYKMIYVGIVMAVVAALFRGVAARTGNDGKHVMEEEGRGFAKAIAWVLWTGAVLIIGIWYGANYTNN